MALNRLGVEAFDNRPPAPVTLPALESLKAPLVDDGAERREVADKFAEYRTVRAGVECWQAISTVNTFEAWTKIGKSLQVGRNHALRATGANRPAGQIYCKAFSAWITKHGFNGIEKTVRSAALDLVEHLAEIEAWRLRLGEKRQRAAKAPSQQRGRMAKGNTGQEHRPIQSRSPGMAAFLCLRDGIAGG
jgi:hypothetical protein